MTEPANDDLTALCYRDGAWTRIPDPMGAKGDFDELLGRAGFYRWQKLVGEDGAGWQIVTWRREDPPPRYHLAIDDGNAIENVYADDLPDALDLLARWAPIVQASHIAGLIAELRGVPSGYGIVEEVVNRAVWAMQHAPWDPRDRVPRP